MRLVRSLVAPLLLTVAAWSAPAALAQGSSDGGTGNAAAAAADAAGQLAPASTAGQEGTGLVEIPRYWCGQQCPAGSCQTWCSFQQRCYTTCSPQGQASCYCIF